MKTRIIQYISALINEIFSPIYYSLKPIVKRNLLQLVFLFLPIVYLINAMVVHYGYGYFYIDSVDPEYFHLYNGILIAAGNLSVDYIAHPGTPLQFIIAIAARIIHFFQPHKNLAKDFIEDPEKYILAANLFINLLISATIYLSGKLIKKYSGETLLGIILQLAVFGNTSLLVISGRLLPESVMIIPLLFIAALTISYIFKKENQSTNIQYTVLFALLIGFGIACKFSFVPLILLPLILLKTSIKYKLHLLVYIGVFTAILAYPIILNFNEMWDWLSGMFLHSGMYGSGEKSFIDISSIPNNFSTLYNYDKLFFVLIPLSSIIGLVYLLVGKNKNDVITRKTTRAIFAVNASLILSIVFTLKHFALHYFMPFYVFKFFLILLSILLIIKTKPFINSKKLKNTLIILTASFSIFNCYVHAQRTRASITHIQLRQKEHLAIKDTILSLIDKNSPIIITGHYSGSPFIEYAHCNGILMSGKLKPYFKPTLIEKYPNTFHYFSWTDKFYFWDDFVDLEYITAINKSKLYVYIGKEKGSDLAEIETRIYSFISSKEIDKTILFQDESTEEKLIEYRFHTPKL